MPMDSKNQGLSQSKMSLVKKLGSCGKRNQNDAVEVLKFWLMTQNEIKEDDLRKSWKGLFCMMNGHPSQCVLVEKLLAIIGALDFNLARQYLQVFLMALRREWGGLDHFNLNKFNLLLGGILHHMHFVLEKNGWDCALVNGFMGNTVQRTLLAVNRPQGMNSYFTDMYLNELHCFFPVTLDNFGHLIDMKLHFNRVKDNVFVGLLENVGDLLKGIQGQDVDKKVQDLKSIGITNRLLQLDALPSTLQDNRKYLYQLHREFSWLYKQLTASGVVISFHGAMMPKIDHNISTKQISEVKSLSIHEIRAVSDFPINNQQVNNIEITNQVSEQEEINLDSKMLSGKAQLIESTIKEGLMSKFHVKYRNGFSGSLENNFSVEAEEVQDSTDEVTINHARSYHYLINDVNEEERLEVVRGDDEDMMMLAASVSSNLEQEFEEEEFEEAEFNKCTSQVPSFAASASPMDTGSKKRTREQILENGLDGSSSPESCHDSDGDIVFSDLLCEVASAGGSEQKNVKKVRFSLKNNIVWRPHNPLPPESLRFPPSATPRGSALKKGVPPGPICIIKKSPRKKPATRQNTVAVQKTVKATKSYSTSHMVLRKQRPVAR